MSWEKVPMSEFLKHRDLRFKPKDEQIIDLRRIEKIDFSGNIITSTKPSNTDMILVKNGDLVISRINVEKGAMAIYQGQEDITATIHYSSYEFDKAKIDEEFLKSFLKSKAFIRAIKEQVPGGIKTEIKAKHLLPLLVQIPSDIEDQKRIVNALKKKNNKIEEILSQQSHQLYLLKELRQQILRDAVHGKLVQQDPNDEPASVLLARIKAEKEKLVREKKIKKEQPLPLIKPEDIPFEIPENWVWCRLGEILMHKPQNGYSPIESKKGKGIKCLTLTSTTSGTFKADYFKYVDVEISPDSFLWIKPNDILIQRGNSIEYVGIAAIYKGNTNEFIYPDLMIKIRVFDWISAEFIHQVLISPYLRNYFQSKAFGAQKSMPKINQEVITHTLIPLPPLSEQLRILANVEMLIKICDEMGYTIQQNQKYTQELLRVALKEALERKQN